MNIQPGTIIISAPSLDDPNFSRAVIIITEHNEKGALGFIINKQFSRRFNELEEFKESKALLLYEGGPVDKEHIFVLHRQPILIEDSLPVSGNVYMGGNFEQAVSLINKEAINSSDIKLFIGYCGWDNNELQEEINEGSWLIADAAEEIIFSHHTEVLWEKLYEQRNK